MEIWGFYIGSKKKLVDAIERETRQKIEREISESLENLVGDELKRLRETLEATAKQRDEARAILASRNIELEKLRSRLGALRMTAEDQKYQIENEQERLRVELFDYIEEYLCVKPAKVLPVIRAMRDKNLLYAKAFFMTCRKIDEAVSEVLSAEIPYGLQILEAYEEGCKVGYEIDSARAISWYAQTEISGIQKDHRLSAFAYIIDITKKGEIEKAITEYKKQQIHRDYVLTLNKTARELIRIRDQVFNGSWTAMLKTAEQTEKDANSITLQEEAALAVPLIRNLMEYEQRNGIVLEFSGKDF